MTMFGSKLAAWAGAIWLPNSNAMAAARLVRVPDRSLPGRAAEWLVAE